MRRFAMVVVWALSAACGAADEGLDGLYGSGNPEDDTLAQRGGGGGGGGDATGGDSDAIVPSDADDSHDVGDGDVDGTPGADGDVDPADCEPVPPPPVSCPTVECPEWPQLCDGDVLTIHGGHFAHPDQASLVVRFVGDYTADGRAAAEVDVRYRATYVSASEATFVFDAGSAPRGFGAEGGAFNGWVYAVNVEPDGTEWTSAPVSIAIMF